MRRKYSKPILVLLGLLLCAIIAGVCNWPTLHARILDALSFPGPNWTEANLTLSKKRGDAVVEAIKLFKHDKNIFPATLEEAAVHARTSFEPPVAGVGKWVYARNGDSFTLSFAAASSGYPYYYYKSDDRLWYNGE